MISIFVSFPLRHLIIITWWGLVPDSFTGDRSKGLQNSTQNYYWISPLQAWREAGIFSATEILKFKYLSWLATGEKVLE